jgi:septal ring factor EnvC (AmiA/AmiB activator)
MPILPKKMPLATLLAYAAAFMYLIYRNDSTKVGFAFMCAILTSLVVRHEYLILLGGVIGAEILSTVTSLEPFQVIQDEKNEIRWSAQKTNEVEALKNEKANAAASCQAKLQAKETDIYRLTSEKDDLTDKLNNSSSQLLQLNDRVINLATALQSVLRLLQGQELPSVDEVTQSVCQS